MSFQRPNLIFTDSFDFCRDTFLLGDKQSVLGEIFEYLLDPNHKTEPAMCGDHRARTKLLLINTGYVLIYWNYGRVWEICGIIEIKNKKEQLKKFKNYLIKRRDND